MLFHLVCRSNHMPFTHQGKEHLGIFALTGKPSSSPVMSSIFSHLTSNAHSADFDEFKILFSCTDTYELMIHESLLKYLSSNPFFTCRAAQFRSTFNNSLFSVCFVFLFVLSCCVLFFTLNPSSSFTLCNITP